jgi:hypothetical protein
MVKDSEAFWCYECGRRLDGAAPCSFCAERKWQRELREQERREAAEQQRISRAENSRSNSHPNNYGSGSSAGGGILAIPGAIILLIAKWDLVSAVWLSIGSFMAPLLPFGLSYIAATVIVGFALLICGYILAVLVVFGGCLAVIGAIFIPVFYFLVFRELPPGMNFPSREPIHQQRQQARPTPR